MEIKFPWCGVKFDRNLTPNAKEEMDGKVEAEEFLSNFHLGYHHWMPVASSNGEVYVIEICPQSSQFRKTKEYEIQRPTL